MLHILANIIMVKCNDSIILPTEEDNTKEEEKSKIKENTEEFRSRYDTESNVPYVFRLQDETGSTAEKLERDTTTSASIYSAYKQRIDSMFDETRSQISCYGGNGESLRMKYYKRAALHYEKYSEEMQSESQQRGINNAVQARIEKMFADMAKSGVAKKEKNPDKNSPHPYEALPPVITGNSFNVDYLGSVPLTEKVTSLQGLQEPLKNLYFSYCRAIETQHVGRCWSGGTLEISNQGLKVHHRGRDNGELEQLNPFPTIAVWAAVKFVCRKKSRKNSEKEKHMEYAFLPLIADPEAIDKGSLFRPLNESEENLILSITSQKYSKKSTFNHHSPMFAVVMRKIGISRQLECHGFVCVCSEDAIVIAANLYQALMTNMKRKNHNYPRSDRYFQPKTKNGISCISIGDSSITNENCRDGHSILEIRNDKNIKRDTYIHSETESQDNVIDKSLLYLQKTCKDKTNKTSVESGINTTTVAKIPPPIPVRPPRRNKRTSSSGSEDGEDTIQIPHTESNDWKHIPNGRCSSQSGSSENEILRANCLELSENNITPVRRSVSERQSFNSIQIASDFTDGGDILTKVAIPRSRSFLNASGPFTRYKRNQKYGELYSNGSGGTGSSPLGFNELFTEFKVQEGLSSMDDILDVIIDAEGMSFNDLKPIYKEFLLKLAVTLTKDELYQRSKSIMRKQKKKLGTRSSCKRKKTFPASGGFKRVFRRSVSKLRPSKTRLTNFEFTSVLFPSESVQVSRKVKKIPSIESSTTSTSSYTTRTLRMKRQLSTKSSGFVEGARLPRRLNNYRRSQQRGNMIKMIKQSQASTSEDSDFFSMVKCGRTTASSIKKTDLNNGEGPNRSSSGYFSCSECSYDSESCTCTSADKCYCSQGETKRKSWLQGAENSIPKDTSLSSCGCDTDSCIESDKCYCSVPYHHHQKDHKKVHKSEQANVISQHCETYSNHKLTEDLPNLNTSKDSVFEELRQRGFVASESSLSRADSPNTAWQKNERSLVVSDRKNYPGSIKSTKSLEFLQVATPTACSSVWDIQSNDKKEPRFTNRMDVYEPLPLPYKNSSSQRSSFNDKCRSYSSENIPLDYEVLTSSKSEDEDTSGTSSQKHQRKVLVVSARDPRGRIIYMGASCRSDQGRICGNNSSPVSRVANTTKSHFKVGSEKGTTANACEALSVKKSAEIAALFSDFKFTQTRDSVSRCRDVSNNSVRRDLFYSSHEPFNKLIAKGRKQQLGNNLENSLGYLP